MNAINRLERKFESSNKAHKGKIISGAKERATKQYFKDTAARARRKQGKKNYDTFRRDEQPTEEDLRLEDIHFANFLGIKDTLHGVPYNNIHIDYPVNLGECDMLRPETEEFLPKSHFENVPDGFSLSEHEEDWMDMRQIEREPNSKAYMDMVYIPETKTLTSNGWYFKRGPDNETDEQQEAKRSRISEEEQDYDSIIGSEDNSHIPVPPIANWESINTWPAGTWDNSKYCQERNKQEQQLFVEQNPDVGRFTVECLQQASEEANFSAMVSYMREQVELAEQITQEELYPCDCSK
jgi:hypothetical protein